MRGKSWKWLGMTFLAGAFLSASVLGPAGAEGQKKENPCAAKANPCNPCAAKGNPCAAKKAGNPCNPCAAGGSQGASAKARMIIAKVISADPNRLLVEWNNQRLPIAVHDKTRFTRGASPSSVSTVKPGERIIVSMLDRGGRLSATYVYLAKAAASGNPCNPCAAKANPCNPCAAKGNPCAAKKAGNPCNPCAVKK